MAFITSPFILGSNLFMLSHIESYILLKSRGTETNIVGLNNFKSSLILETSPL